MDFEISGKLQVIEAGYLLAKEDIDAMEHGLSTGTTLVV